MLIFLLVTWAWSAEPKPAAAYEVPHGVDQARVAPDGDRVAWSRSVDGGRALFVAPAHDLARHRVVFEAKDPRWAWEWSLRPGEILVRRWRGLQGEDPGLLAVDVEQGSVERILEGQGFGPVGMARDDPSRVWVQVLVDEPRKRSSEPVYGPSDDPGVAEEVVVSRRKARSRRWSKAMRVDLESGAVEELWRGTPWGVVLFDGDGNPRALFQSGNRYVYRGTPDEAWVTTDAHVRAIDPTGKDRHVVSFDRPSTMEGTIEYLAGHAVVEDEIFLLSARGVPRRSVVALNLETGRRRVVWTPEEGDAVAARLTASGELLWGAVDLERMRWVVGPEPVRAALDARFPDAVWSLWGCSLDDAVCVVRTHAGHDPGSTWIWHRADGRFDRVPDPALDAFRARGWRPMETATIPSRDGLPLRLLWTRPDPARFGSAPHPLVVVVHGGPYARDRFWFREDHQWLADHGYAVLSVNFRGSDGFGEAFRRASDGEWGRGMQNDLLDAVDHLVAQGVADPERVAITGISYGGYATLHALVTTDRFACGIAGAALATLLKGGSDLEVSGLGTRAHRRARSPVTHVDGLSSPLLVWHGDADRVVPRRLVQPFVDAAVAGGAPITFVTYPEAGHGLTGADAAAQRALEATFLAGCLGGVPHPLDEVLAASTMRVEAGGAWIPGAQPAAGPAAPVEEAP